MRDTIFDHQLKFFLWSIASGSE